MENPTRTSLPIWIAAAALAALATAICFDALPGINWLIWTTAAFAGLVYFVQRRHGTIGIIGPIAIYSVLLTGAAAVSSNEVINFVTVLLIIGALALSMLLSNGPWVQRITAVLAISAPILAFSNAVVTSFHQAAAATEHVRSSRARSTLRGLAITLPIVVVFALLLAVADPTFALWRNTIRDLVTNWEFVPRTIFFIGMLVISLGAFAYATYSADAAAPVAVAPRRWLGSAERLMLIGSITALLWIFLAVQLSYLFGNLPRVTGSGVTFSDYARRGFGELTIVAGATALLIIGSERFGVRDHREKIARLTTFALIAAVLFLLGSAFNRVLLYEQAYGFTTARLYAQAFMVVVASGLLALALEVAGELDPGRVFRRTGSVALIVFIFLAYWNHQGWIAGRNIERFAATGKLDASYLVRDLSLDAVPEIVESLPRLPEPARTDLRNALVKRYMNRKQIFNSDWYEWNLRREKAQAALAGLGLP